MEIFYRPNLRIKLITIMLISTLLGLASVGFALYFQFQSFLYSRFQAVLQQYVDLADQAFNKQKMLEGDALYLQSFVDSTSKIVNSRFTIISIDGVVLADSEIPRNRLPQIENHINRPEVQQSLREGYGFFIRRSGTINRDLLYLSKRIEVNGEAAGFIRIALFAEAANQMLATARNYFIGGGIIILLVSTLLIVLLFKRINDNLQEVIENANKIAGGDLNARIKIDSKDELNELGDCLNGMAAKLSDYLRKLTHERKELNTVLSSINEGIFAIDSHKKIIFFNKIALKFLNIQTDEISRKYYYQVIRDQHLNSLIDTFLEKPFLISDEIQTIEGRMLEVAITALSSEDVGNQGTVIVLRDVSQYKKLEKIRRDFVANVSHEFKTPLAAIRGYSETLLDWGLEDTNVNRKYVHKIVKQSHQLENLVSDLLQLARLERLQTLELQKFNPTPIIQNVMEEYSDIADTHTIKLVANLPEYGKPILGDPEMFRSIIANLIDNAIKYTQEGLVTISSQESKSHRTYLVTDTGIGIPQKYQERIFERFYRVDKARSRAIDGTGLGLSIVKHLVELQRAEVWVNSKEGEGSCFSVKFNLADETSR